MSTWVLISLRDLSAFQTEHRQNLSHECKKRRVSRSRACAYARLTFPYKGDSKMPNFFSRFQSSSSPSPKKIQNQFYKNLREFTAWNPWGTAPDHSISNDEYIPITGAFVKQFDYPAALERLIEFGWKTATKPTGPRALQVTLGAKRPGEIDMKGAPSQLRTNFGRPMRGNWNHITKFEQVAAYAFRGDARPPEEVQSAGGFFPPSSRIDASYINTIATQFYEYMNRKKELNLDPQAKDDWVQKMETYIRNPTNAADRKLFDEYFFWRQVLDQEQMHLQAMTNNSFLKGYISTTRDIYKARGGASRNARRDWRRHHIRLWLDLRASGKVRISAEEGHWRNYQKRGRNRSSWSYRMGGRDRLPWHASRRNENLHQESVRPAGLRGIQTHSRHPERHEQPDLARPKEIKRKN